MICIVTFFKTTKKYFAKDCDKVSWKNADIERVNEGREPTPRLTRKSYVKTYAEKHKT